MGRIIGKLAGAMCIAMALQGCVVAVGYAISEVVENEEKRLAEISQWESEMAAMDCTQLTAEHANLVANKDTYFVDFDQREDSVRDKLNEKGCELPEALQS
ncbi:MAG: hypothetical protein AAGD13_24880 [Pseudomonadota bacterium]